MATASPNILVVEDDRETRALIAKYLRSNACNVTTATDGREMVRAMADHRVDLLILDVMLPGEDGLSLCRKVRAESQMPIIMLTARGEDVDRILGLEMGADDYLAKPFNPRELLARINAVLRRQAAAQTVSATSGATALTFLGWRIDFRLRELRNPAGARVAMTSAEFDLLRTFCERPGRVLSRDSLLDLTQGRNAGSFERSIDVLVSRIRRKIEPDPQDATMIKTVRSGGYMFTPAVDAVTTSATADHEAARLSEPEDDQRTDRSAGGRLDRRDSPDPDRDLSHQPAGPARSLDRPRPRPARRGGPASRRGAGGRTAAAFRRHRAGISAARHRKPRTRPGSRRERAGRPATCAACTAGSAAATGSSRSRTTHDDHKVGIALPDGAMISAKILPDQRQRPFWGGPWMVTLLFAIVSVTLLGLWAARALTAPLSSFAKAAESFSLNGAAAPLPERGPEEIRSVAKALNRMRERITTLIDDRTKMLAAISHDLRTPITRMRLRSEFIEDDMHRSRMLRDLDQMRSMLESVLSFLRNDRKLEAMTLVDIATTLQLVTDQFADMGHKVGLRRPGARHGHGAARRSASQRHQPRRERGQVRRGGHHPPWRVAGYRDDRGRGRRSRHFRCAQGCDAGTVRARRRRPQHG